MTSLMNRFWASPSRTYDGGGCVRGVGGRLVRFGPHPRSVGQWGQPCRSDSTSKSIGAGLQFLFQPPRSTRPIHPRPNNVMLLGMMGTIRCILIRYDVPKSQRTLNPPPINRPISPCPFSTIQQADDRHGGLLGRRRQLLGVGGRARARGGDRGHWRAAVAAAAAAAAAVGGLRACTIW